MIGCLEKNSQIEAESLDQFIELMQQEGRNSVVAEPILEPSYSFSSGYEWNVSSKFTSQALGGSSIILDQYYGIWWGEFNQFNKITKLNHYTMSDMEVFANLHRKLETIKERLPDVMTYILGPSGIIGSGSPTYQRMLETARTYNLRVS